MVSHIASYCLRAIWSSILGRISAIGVSTSSTRDHLPCRYRYLACQLRNCTLAFQSSSRSANKRNPDIKSIACCQLPCWLKNVTRRITNSGSDRSFCSSHLAAKIMSSISSAIVDAAERSSISLDLSRAMKKWACRSEATSCNDRSAANSLAKRYMREWNTNRLEQDMSSKEKRWRQPKRSWTIDSSQPPAAIAAWSEKPLSAQTLKQEKKSISSGLRRLRLSDMDARTFKSTSPGYWSFESRVRSSLKDCS